MGDAGVRLIKHNLGGPRLPIIGLVVLLTGALVAVPSGNAADQNTLRIADAEVVEGDPGATPALSFQITLTRGHSAPVSVIAETMLEGTAADGTTRQGTATPARDYQRTRQTITFEGSETSKSFRVPVFSDEAAEEDEDLFVELWNAQGAGIADAQAIGIIRDDDRRGVSVADASGLERGQNPDCLAMAPHNCAVFKVTLDKALRQPASVAYQTQDGTARAGEDYEASSGTVEFAAGSTEQTISVKILRDEPPEPKETFLVKLSTPVNTPIDDGEAVGTIEDGHAVSIDDAVGHESGKSDQTYTSGPSLFSGQSSVVFPGHPRATCLPKPGACVTFQVNLKETKEEVTVVFKTRDSGADMGTATPGKDYEPTERLVVFPPGVVQQLVSVPIVQDRVPESDEHFYVDLSASRNAALEDPQARGVIKDDSVVSLEDDVRVLEGTSPQPPVTAVFQVNLAGPQSVPVKVDYKTHDATATARTNDYQALSGTLEFAPGQTVRVVPVQVTPDGLREDDEVFSLVLSNPQGAVIEQDSAPTAVTPARTPGRAKATILDDDMATQGPSALVDETRQRGRDQIEQIPEPSILREPCPSPSPVAGQQTPPVPEEAPCGEDVGDAYDSVLPPRSYPPHSGQAGGVFLTGHDADLHSREGAASGENRTGARNIIKKAVAYVTRDKSNPRLLLVMDLEGKIKKDWADPRFGLRDSGFPGFDTADYGSGEPGMLDLDTVDFGSYDAVLVASGHRRWFTQRELDILVRRKADLTDFVNRGGGLIAFEEGEQQWQEMRVPMQNPYGFLPCLVSTVPKGSFESGYRLTQQGRAMGLRDSDMNGNHSHNHFTHAGGFDVIDYDTEARIISVATLEGLSPEGCARSAGMTIEDSFAKEGHSGLSYARFTVRLDRSYAQPVSVDFTTVDVDATSGVDYVPTLASSPLVRSGSVTFAPGETVRVIEIPVIGDTLIENDETFLVRLSNAQNAKVIRDQAVGTIVDDDQASSPGGPPPDGNEEGTPDPGAGVGRQDGTGSGQGPGPTSQSQGHAPPSPPQFQSPTEVIAQGQAQAIGSQAQGLGQPELQFQSHQATERSYLSQTQTQATAAVQSSIAAERERQKQSQPETLKDSSASSNASSPQDRGKYLAAARTPFSGAPPFMPALAPAVMIASMCLLRYRRAGAARPSPLRYRPAPIHLRKASPARAGAKAGASQARRRGR